MTYGRGRYFAIFRITNFIQIGRFPEHIKRSELQLASNDSSFSTDTVGHVPCHEELLGFPLLRPFGAHLNKVVFNNGCVMLA